MASGLPLVDKLKEQFSVSSYADYQRNMAKKRVVNELSKLIINQPVETDSNSSSNLFKILTKRFKAQLSRTEKDPTVCDTAARKLAKFVETIMKEAYFTQKYNKRSASFHSRSAVPSAREPGELTNRNRSHDFHTGVSDSRDSRESVLERDVIIKGLEFPESCSSLSVKKVPRSFARNVTKCGPLYTANMGGRKVFVQEVREGESKKALISRVNSESSDPNLESSSWMVDLAHKTKEWIKWLDDKASVVERKSTRNVLDPMCSWATSETPAPQSTILEVPDRRRTIYQNNGRDPSDGHIGEARNRPRESRRSVTDGGGGRTEFYIAPASNSSDFMFSSSTRNCQRPPGSV